MVGSVAGLPTMACAALGYAAVGSAANTLRTGSDRNGSIWCENGLAVKNENIPLNTGKQQHHKRHGHNGTQRGHYVDCAGIVCIVSVYLTHLCNGGC